MKDDNGYAQLLHDLGQLRSGDVKANAQARSRVTAEAERVAELKSKLDSVQGRLVEAARSLDAPAPDLRPSAGADPDKQPAPSGDVDAEVDAAHAALGTTEGRVTRALRAAQLPSLLPHGHPFVRNLIVYSAAMIACLLFQLLLGLSPAPVPAMWLAFAPPVAFLAVGYVFTAVAGSPRSPMYDEQGREVAFTVKKSPRLGAFLAVATIVLFLFVVAPWANSPVF